jgi:Trk K+ transport system NAD-binding subunit
MTSKYPSRNGWSTSAPARRDLREIIFPAATDAAKTRNTIRQPAQVLERLGANEVILPIRDMAYRFAERLRDKTTGERFPIAGEYHLAEVVLGAKLGCQVFDRTKIHEQFDVTPLPVKQPDGERVAVHEPDLNMRLAACDALWVLGLRDELNKFACECGMQH